MTEVSGANIGRAASPVVESREEVNDRIKRITGLIDSVLDDCQRSSEPSYGDDIAGTCVRTGCYSPPGDDSDFCGPCRAYMLGDTDTDPARGIAARVAELHPRALSNLARFDREVVQEHLDAAVPGGVVTAEMLHNAGITDPGPHWLYYPAPDWWRKIDPAELQDPNAAAGWEDDNPRWERLALNAGWIPDGSAIMVGGPLHGLVMTVRGSEVRAPVWADPPAAALNPSPELITEAVYRERQYVTSSQAFRLFHCAETFECLAHQCFGVGGAGQSR